MDSLKGFKIVHLNCRSLFPKLTQIDVLFANIDVLCLTETWLHDSFTDDILSLDGKKLFRWDRSNGCHNGVYKSRGGGVACYLKSSLSADSQLLTSLCTSTPDIELLTLKVLSKPRKTRYVITVYRPPDGDIDSFFHILENVILTHDLHNKELWITGDLNIDYLKRNHRSTKKAIDFARIYGLHQIINEATHITGFSKSCIDLMFTNANFICSSGVLNEVISDHFPIFACVKKEREERTYTWVRARTYTAYHKTNFQTLLSEANWKCIFDCQDPNEIWKAVLVKIEEILKTMCPIKNIRVTKSKPFWLSHHILEAISDRNKLYAKAKNSNNIDDLNRARVARNRTNKLINSSKEEFVKDSLETNKSDPKKFWRIINNTIIKKGSNSDHTNLTHADGHILSLEDSCEYMNDYLVSIGDNLEREFSGVNSGPSRYYLKDSIISNYVITKEDVVCCLKEIDNSKGSGIDFIPTFVIKDAFNCIPDVIAHLMNQSLKTGIFPKSWSLASVTPIPKGGDPHMASNWRPISILPLPGKILEKICCRFLLMELDTNLILSRYQFGFRSGLSTSHAIFYYVKNITDGINDKNVTASVYLDFARAFDSVNFDILLSKLKDMGISEILQNWIKGYLSNRAICTKFNGFISSSKKLLCGVPQGSVVGPILFLCYINDISEIAHKHDIQMSLYADDAVIYRTSDDVLSTQTKLQLALNDVILWCTRNHINLNIKKTKLCCYGTRHSLKHFPIRLTLKETKLTSVSQYTYLGIVLDETLNLEANFNSIFKKFSYKLFQFSKIRKYLPLKLRVLVYKQAILPLVEYVSYLMFLNRKHDIEKLQKLQNKALRVCHGIVDPRTISVSALHIQSDLLTLSQRREQQLLNLMYDITRDNPEFIKHSGVRTRQADKIILASDIVHCSVYARSPYIAGCTLWNGLDADIQKLEQKSVYKACVKTLYK